MPNGHYNWNELTREEKERILSAWREETKAAFDNWVSQKYGPRGTVKLFLDQLEEAFIAGAKYARGNRKL